MDVFINIPSSISGGNPPTKTFRENRSLTSDPWLCGDDRAGDPIGNTGPSTKPPASSFICSSNPGKNGLPRNEKYTHIEHRVYS